MVPSSAKGTKLMMTKRYGASRSYKGEMQVLSPLPKLKLVGLREKENFPPHLTTLLPQAYEVSQLLHCEPQFLRYINLRLFNTLYTSSINEVIVSHYS